MRAANEMQPVPPARLSRSCGVDGFYRVVQEPSGSWTLLAPDGEPFFCRAVHGVRVASLAGDAAPPRDSAARLRAWGFNTLGVGADASLRDDGLAFVGEVGFCGTLPHFSAGGVRLPDVFDPEWPRLAMARALEVCAPFADCRELIGWVTDDALAWGEQISGVLAAGPVIGRPGLLQVCLSLEPSCPAYHAAWEFTLALHGGRIDALARAWGVPLANKEVVREMTRAEAAIATRGYARDEARWAREFARRYFTTTAAAIRAADQNHLVLGCRFREGVPPAVIAECVYPSVDVAMPVWTELPMAPMPGAQPMLPDVCWAGPAFTQPGKGRDRRLTSVERMLRRARLALDRLARHPAVVGYSWTQWQDEPGELPPFARGLIHVNGADAREHTELIADFNARVSAARRASATANFP